MQQIKYASTAWNDIKNSPGWFGKVFLLALLQIIPIFGQIVLLGYLYGWARDIAWGVHAPLPAKIFGNEDGKLYSRGFFILVISFVFGLIPGVISGFAGTITSGGATFGMAVGSAAPSVLAATFGGILGLAGFALSLAVIIAFNIAAMRTAIYDRISAGFQLKKIWAMFRHDTNGALRIFGMELLVGLLGGLVIGIVGFVFFLLVGLSFIPGVIHLDNLVNPGFIDVMSALGPGLGLFTLLALALGFVYAILATLLYALVARASGYWLQQFQVAQWRGQDDPMPFEIAQMQQQAAVQQQPPTYPGV